MANRTQEALPFSVASAVLRLVLALASMVLLVRYLPREEYGVWILLAGLADPVNLVSALGYRNALNRFIPAIEDPRDRAHLVWSVFARRSLIALVISLGLVAGFDLFAQRIGIEAYESQFRIVQLGMICGIGYRYLEAALHASFDQRAVLVLDLFYNVLLVGGTIIGIALGRDISFFCWNFSAASLMRLAVSLILCSHRFGRPALGWLIQMRPESVPDRKYRRMSYLTELGTVFLGTGVDNYLLAAVSSAPQVAIYAVAAKISKQLEMLVPQRMFRRLSQTAFFTRYDQSEDLQATNRMFRFLFTTNNIVGMLCLSLFVAHGSYALNVVFDSGYQDAFAPTLLFLGFLTFSTMPMGVVAQAVRKPEILVYSRVTVILNLALGLPLAYQYGATGMAAATAVSTGVKSLIEYVLLRRHLPIAAPWASTAKCLVSAAGVAILMTWMTTFIHPVLSGILGSIVYLASIRILHVLSDWERALITNLGPRRFERWLSLLIGPAASTR